jgi:hypothetical protein
MDLMLSIAVENPGKGWRINGFGLVLIAAILIAGFLMAPQFFGSGVVGGGAWKITKLVFDKGRPGP